MPIKIVHESVVIKSIFVGVEGSDCVLLLKTKKGCLDQRSPL